MRSKENPLRTIFYKEINDVIAFKKQLLQWSQQFREIVFLDSNDYHQKYSNYDLILAVDAFTSVETDYQNAFQDLYEYQSRTKDWLFGYLTYDLKNDIENIRFSFYLFHTIFEILIISPFSVAFL